MSMSLEQLEDDIVDERLQLIKEYTLKGIIPLNDLVLAINCIDIDCKDLDRCSVCKGNDYCSQPVAHFEIPQLMLDYGFTPIVYLGTTDRQSPFLYYTSVNAFNYFRKYRKRGKNKPFVWIDTTPNENGHYDCYVFNAPLLKYITVVAIFKDPRQLCDFDCEGEYKDDNFTWINNEIKKRLTEKKIRYYRSLQPPLIGNTQEYV